MNLKKLFQIQKDYSHNVITVSLTLSKLFIMNSDHLPYKNILQKNI